jgi:hypothetical protein
MDLLDKEMLLSKHIVLCSCSNIDCLDIFLAFCCLSIEREWCLCHCAWKEKRVTWKQRTKTWRWMKNEMHLWWTRVTDIKEENFDTRNRRTLFSLRLEQYCSSLKRGRESFLKIKGKKKAISWSIVSEKKSKYKYSLESMMHIKQIRRRGKTFRSLILEKQSKRCRRSYDKKYNSCTTGNIYSHERRRS